MTEAEAAHRAYNRGSWIRFVLAFFPVPFFLVLFRLNIEAWAYYAAGAAYVGFGILLYVLDGRARARRDAIVNRVP